MNEEIEKIFNEYKTINRTKIEGNNFLKVESYLCELNNGKKIKREKILKGGKDGNAVVIFPITKEKKVILAIEPRVFTKKTVDIGLPSGYIEEDERPYDAALRELKEETGYVAKDLECIGSYYQDQGCMAALNHYYIAYNCEKKYDQNLDEGELIKYIEVSLDELQYLIRNNYIMNLNSIFTIERAKKYIKEM